MRLANKITLARVPGRSAQSAQYEKSLLPDEGIQPSRAYIQNIILYLSYLSPPQPLTVERRRGRPASSIRVNALTCCEPFEQNTRIRVGMGVDAGARFIMWPFIVMAGSPTCKVTESTMTSLGEPYG